MKEKEVNSKINYTTEVYNPVCYHIEEDCKYRSTNYTIDHLKQHLATVRHTFILENGKAVIAVRKYYDQAFYLLKIGTFKPNPSFIIYLSDLEKDTHLLKELCKLDKGTLRTLMIKTLFNHIKSTRC